MLTIAKIDRYDMVNNPMDDTASVTLWFSGCSFKCKKCHNKNLWDKANGTRYRADSVASIVVRTCRKLNVGSVVLLGGEPLQQDRNDLILLCRLLKEAGLKIWLYTGYEFEEVDKNILQYVYTIKCGRYINNKKQDGFPASSNQKVYRSIAGNFKDITTEIGGIIK